MKIGVLSDIHGNYHALQEVLKSARKQGVEHLLVLGDLIGYYYYPDVVLDLLSNWNYILIQGNHEGFINEVEAEPERINSITEKYGKGLQFAMEKLNSDILAMLGGLPSRKSVNFDSVNFFICHGSPWSRDQYVYPDAPSDLVERCGQVSTDFLLMGHTHYPCVFKNNRSLIANVGSVGQSRVMGGVANWAIINTENKAYIAQATQYSVEEVIKEVRAKDPHLPYLADVLLR